jgi:TIR domain/SIR2-like domain
MKDSQWKSLVGSLLTRNCVLVLGPDVTASRRDDPTTLQTIRDAFSEHLIKELESEGIHADEKVMFAVAQQYEDIGIANPKYLARDFLRRLEFDPGQIHNLLAACPFQTVLTNCSDQLFERALKSVNKDPQTYWYNYKGTESDNYELESPGTMNQPIVYHLYGTFEDPNSLVLSENDLLDFITAIVSERPKLPNTLKNALKDKTFLFVGFGIKFWYVRVILKLLAKTLNIAKGSFAQESLTGLADGERDQTVLFYKRGTRLEVVDMDALTFCQELSQRLAEAGDLEISPRSKPSKPIQLFISYERSDRELAQRLYKTIPKDQFDPWLDDEQLGPGDWDSAIREKIEDSDFFVVLNSKNLKEREEGYVNAEIDYALKLNKRFRRKNFIVPLHVGELSADLGRPELKEFQQWPLRKESFSDDVAFFASRIKRDFQLRM